MLRQTFASLPPIETEVTLDYLPFKQHGSIRLMVLQPGEFKAPIHIEINEYPLNAAPLYEALSYTWGTGGHRIMAYNGSIPFSMGTNLAIALHYLRSESKPRSLWIDAICIDQRDCPEKESQVSMMAQIYSCADRVVVWLEEDTDEMHTAIEAFPKIHQHFQTCNPQDITCTLRRYMDYATEQGEGRIPLNFSPEEKLALANFFRLPWFSRAWVLQEVSSWPVGKPPVVVIGKTKVCWDLLSTCYTWLSAVGLLWLHGQGDKFFVASIFRSSGIIISAAHNQGPKIRMLELLTRHVSMKSSDPRDMIHSLLGVAESPGRRRHIMGELIPDIVKYTDKVVDCTIRAASQRLWNCYVLMNPPAPPVATRFLDIYYACCRNENSTARDGERERVLVNILPSYSQDPITFIEDSVRMIIADELSLDVLTFSNPEGSDLRKDGFPSWVPNWTECGTLNLVENRANLDGFCASKYVPAWIGPFPKPGLLEVGAIFCDRVQKIASQTLTKNNMVQLYQQLSEMKHDTDTYPSGEPIFEAYLKTITGNNMQYKRDLSDPPSDMFYSSLTKLWNHYCMLKSLSDMGINFEGEENLSQVLLEMYLDEQTTWQDGDQVRFWGLVNGCCVGKRFYICENGWMGIGPSSIKPGDYICVLKGGPVPFVLRGTKINGKISCLPVGETVEKAKTVNTDPVSEDFYPSALDFFETKNRRIIDFFEAEAELEKNPNLSRFSLIGPTYVHGLSNGEALVHIENLYSQDYLWDIGCGWEKIFIE